MSVQSHIHNGCAGARSVLFNQTLASVFSFVCVGVLGQCRFVSVVDVYVTLYPVVQSDIMPKNVVTCFSVHSALRVGTIQ